MIYEKTYTPYILITTICNAQQTKMKENHKNHLEKLNLAGKVKSIKEFTQNKNNSESPLLNTEKEFNENGFLLKETVFSGEKIYSITTYDYQNNKLDTETEKILGSSGYTTVKKYFYKENEVETKTYEDDELVESSITKTDKNNNIIFTKNNNHLFNTYCEKNYEHNQKNQLTTVTENCYNQDGKNYSNTITYTYADGLVTKMKHTNTVANDNVGFVEHYTYNDSKNYIEIKVYVNNVLESKQTMAYQNGLLHEHRFFEKGKETKFISYAYDNLKNSSSKTVSEIGSLATITKEYTYQITYYK
ncbi:hypothetical protein Celly_0934 [Cellulophaga lytica DSM 7489]|uniref:YD repeat protein n=2 Tax=Cellulophaga lytica TaxID=979 RepID=F0RDL7_CELLC|nr:hypothetical protein Celly_0934 [Cellulophaga lytica DSM 7489]